MSNGKTLKELLTRKRELEVRPPGGVVRQTGAQPWHAVSVRPGEKACGTAQEAVDVRFLSKEAPSLPLEGCTLQTCGCRYRHHEDRRHEVRRAADLWTAGRSWLGRERRAMRGRRAEDRPDDGSSRP